MASQIEASQAPLQVWVGGSTGDSCAFVRSASPTLANGKIKINTASNTELTSGAYPARITGDTNIQFEAIFSKAAVAACSRQIQNDTPMNCNCHVETQ